MTVRIYLAGRIAATGVHAWRFDVIDARSFFHEPDTGVLRWDDHSCRGVLSGFTCTGPYFEGCDHRCGHGPATHGCGVSEPGDPFANCCSHPHERTLSAEKRSMVRRASEAAISRSDIIFAWLDDAEAHGTLWELGYASALKKRILIGFNPFDGYDWDELWFAFAAGETLHRCSSPQEALDHFFGPDSIERLLMRTESPIERNLLAAALPGLLARRRDLEVDVQKEVFADARYRLDIAVTGPSLKLAVECDGHDFHERTREQAARDRSRDRSLTLAGWTVLRFTGSEIHADAARCAAQILAACDAATSGLRA